MVEKKSAPESIFFANDKVNKFNSFTGEVLDVKLAHDHIYEVISDPFAIARYRPESLIKLSSENPVNDPFQGKQGSMEVMQANGNEFMHVVTFVNGNPVLTTNSWDGDKAIQGQQEGIFTKKYILDALVAGQYTEASTKTKDGIVYIRMEIPLAGERSSEIKTEYLLVKEDEMYKMQNFLLSRKEQIAPKGPQTLNQGQPIATIEEKVTPQELLPHISEVKLEKGQELNASSNIVDITPRLPRKVTLETPLKKIILPQEKAAIQNDLLKKKITAHVQKNVTDASDAINQLTTLGDAEIKNVMHGQTDVRTRRMTAFLYKGGKLFGANKMKENAVFTRLQTAYEETVANLFPSQSKKTMLDVARNTWEYTKNIIKKMADLFSTITQKKTQHYDASSQKQHISPEHTPSKILVNGEWKERTTQKPIADFTKKFEESQQREIPKAQESKIYHEPITDIRTKQLQKKTSATISELKFTEKTVTSEPVKNIATKVKEKAQGFFGKLSSLFKKSA